MLKRLSVILLSVWLLCGSFTVLGLTEKRDYQYDENFSSVPGPVTYEAERVLYGTSLGVGAFNGPSDLFVDEAERLYIADTGNNRILVFDSEFNLVRTIDTVVSEDGVDTLSGPQGIFARDGLVYICDTGNARVITINENNEVVGNIKGENLVSVNDNFVFRPEKVIVDTNDNILVVSKTIYQGILRFDEEGEFKSFFAPNQVPVSFQTFFISLLRSFFTDAQKESLSKQLPAPYSNIYFGSDGFIYTTAEGVQSGQDIKCLNSAGTNVLVYASTGSGSSQYGDYEGRAGSAAFVDVHRDDDGYILIADRSSNKLFVYDEECNLMSIAGGSGTEKGKFTSISAVEKLGDSYLILDNEKSALTILVPTDYTEKLRAAMEYYREGLYTESEAVWQELLRQNSNLPLAYKSLGRSQYHLGNYKSAMEYLKRGGDTYFYSLALNEYRKELAHDYFVWIVLGAVALCVGLVFLVKWIRKKLLS